MTGPIININQANICRGSRQILYINKLTVDSKEIIGVIGSNGAGKSTLLQTINMLLPVSDGSLQLFGLETTSARTKELRRRSALVFQDSLLLADSVYQNVALPLRFRGLQEIEIRSKVEDALNLFRCKHLIQKQAGRISGGEAQRVTLARALVTEPELLLLDEPFVALDALSRTALLEELRQIVENKGMTAVLVSHNFDEVASFANRVIALDQGTVVQDCSTTEILRQPVNATVANIVGVDNIVPCVLNDCGELLLGGKIIVAGPIKLLSPCSACIPSDAIAIQSATNQARRCWEGRAYVVRIVPGIGLYRIQLRYEDIIIWLRVPVDRAQTLMVGEKIKIVLDWDKVHFVA